MKCPNVNDNKFKQLSAKVGVLGAYGLWSKLDESDITTDLIKSMEPNTNNPKIALNEYNNTNDPTLLSKFVIVPDKVDVGTTTLLAPYDVFSKNKKPNDNVLQPLMSINIDNEYNLTIQSVEKSILGDKVTNNNVIQSILNTNKDNFSAIPHVLYNDQLMVIDETKSINESTNNLMYEFNTNNNAYTPTDEMIDMFNQTRINTSVNESIANVLNYNTEVAYDIAFSNYETNLVKPKILKPSIVNPNIIIGNKLALYSGNVSELNDNLSSNSILDTNTNIQLLQRYINDMFDNKMFNINDVINNYDFKQLYDKHYKRSKNTKIALTNAILEAYNTNTLVSNDITKDLTQLLGKSPYTKQHELVYKPKTLLDLRTDTNKPLVNLVYNDDVSNTLNDEHNIEDVSMDTDNIESNTISKPLILYSKNVQEQAKKSKDTLITHLKQIESNVVFTNDYTSQRNPHTNLRVKDHSYKVKDKNGVEQPIHISATGVLDTNKEFFFDKIKYIGKLISSTPEQSEFFNQTFTQYDDKNGVLVVNVERTHQLKSAFINSIIKNDTAELNNILNQYGKDLFFNFKKINYKLQVVKLKFDDKGEPLMIDKVTTNNNNEEVITKIQDFEVVDIAYNDDEQLFQQEYFKMYQQYTQLILEQYNKMETSSSFSSVIGTSQHRIAEAILKEESDLTADDKLLLDYFDTVKFGLNNPLITANDEQLKNELLKQLNELNIRHTNNVNRIYKDVGIASTLLSMFGFNSSKINSFNNFTSLLSQFPDIKSLFYNQFTDNVTPDKLTLVSKRDKIFILLNKDRVQLSNQFQRFKQALLDSGIMKEDINDPLYYMFGNYTMQNDTALPEFIERLITNTESIQLNNTSDSFTIRDLHDLANSEDVNDKQLFEYISLTKNAQLPKNLSKEDEAKYNRIKNNYREFLLQTNPTLISKPKLNQTNQTNNQTNQTDEFNPNTALDNILNVRNELNIVDVFGNKTHILDYISASIVNRALTNMIESFTNDNTEESFINLTNEGNDIIQAMTDTNKLIADKLKHHPLNSDREPNINGAFKEQLLSKSIMYRGVGNKNQKAVARYTESLEQMFYDYNYIISESIQQEIGTVSSKNYNLERHIRTTYNNSLARQTRAKKLGKLKYSVSNPVLDNFKLEVLSIVNSYERNSLIFMSKLNQLKSKVKANNGVILTEYKIASRILTDKGEQLMGGQIDVLIVYPDEEATPKELRGKFQIYDIKTMSGSHSIDITALGTEVSSNTQRYQQSKQKKHAAQLLIYANAIEKETGLKFDSAHIIPISVAGHTLSEQYKNAMQQHKVNTETLSKEIKELETLRLNNENDIISKGFGTSLQFSKLPQEQQTANNYARTVANIILNNNQTEDNKSGLFFKASTETDEEKRNNADQAQAINLAMLLINVNSQIDVLKGLRKLFVNDDNKPTEKYMEFIESFNDFLTKNYTEEKSFEPDDMFTYIDGKQYNKETYLNMLMSYPLITQAMNMLIEDYENNKSSNNDEFNDDAFIDSFNKIMKDVTEEGKFDLIFNNQKVQLDIKNSLSMIDFITEQESIVDKLLELNSELTDKITDKQNKIKEHTDNLLKAYDHELVPGFSTSIEPLQMFMARNNRVNDKLRGTEFSININQFDKVVFEKAKEIADKTFGKTSYDNLSDEDKIKYDIRKTKYQEALKELFDNLKLNVSQRISAINKQIDKSTTPQERGKLSGELKALQTELDSINNISALNSFIELAEVDIFGNNQGNNVSMETKLQTLVDKFSKGEMSSQDFIQHVDSIRNMIDNYKILDSIQDIFLNNTDVLQAKQIKNSHLFSTLEALIGARNRIEALYYDIISEALAQRLSELASKDADLVKQHIQDVAERNIQQDIDYFNEQIAKNNNKEHYQQKIKEANNQLKQLKNKIDAMDYSKEALMREFKQASSDISGFDLWLFSGINTKDKLLAMYAKLAKFQEIEAEHLAKSYALRLESSLTKLQKATPVSTWNSNNAYDVILEDVTINEFNYDTGKYEVTKTKQFISPYKQMPFKINGTEYMMSHNDIYDYYRRSITQLYKEGKMEDYKKLTNEFDTWKQNNLEPEYTPEFYKWKNSLSNDTKNALNEIDEQIKKIKENAMNDHSNPDKFPLGRNNYFLTADERYDIQELLTKRRLLSSEYDELGNKKEGKELAIAKELQKYNEQFSKFYDFETNTESFDKNERKARSIYGKDTPEYNRWLAENTNIVLTDNFWKNYARKASTKQFYKFANDYLDKAFTVTVGKNKTGKTEAISLSNNNFNPKLIDAINEISSLFDSTEITDDMFQTEYNNIIEKYGLTKDFNKFKEEQKVTDAETKLQELIKPYKTKGRVDGSHATLETREQIKILQQEVNDELGNIYKKLGQTKQNLNILYNNLQVKKSSNKLTDSEQEVINNISIYNTSIALIERNIQLVQNDISLFVKYEITPEYYAERDVVIASIKLYNSKNPDKKLTLEQTQWYKANHVTREIRDEAGNQEIIVEPIRLWTNMIHMQSTRRNNQNKTPNKAYYDAYNRHKDMVIQVRRDLYKKKLPNTTDADIDIMINQDMDNIENKVKTLQWYKDNHDKDGNVKSAHYLELVDDNYYSKREPNEQYKHAVIKDEYVRPDNEVRDIQGRIKPLAYHPITKQPLWSNPKYATVNNNSAWGVFHKEVTGIYNEIQERFLPKVHRMGNVVPQVTINTALDTLISAKGNKLKALANYTKDNSLISNQEIDVDDKIASTPSIFNRFVPMRHTSKVDYDRLNTNIPNTLMMFIIAATKHHTRSNILGETRALLSLLDKRESVDGLGTKRLDIFGNPIKDGTAKRAGVDTDLRQSEPSKAKRKAEAFIAAHIFDESNTPYEWSVFNKTVRVDKVMDSVMGLASRLQIGGFTALLWGSTGSIVKGFTNWANAQIQVRIEAAAGRYFDKASWLTGKYKYSKIALQSMATDFQSLTKKSIAGQLFDHFDPMVGTFTDKFGRMVPQNNIKYLMSSDLWFMNQYAGEYDTAMTTLYAYLNSVKVVNGEVYTLEQYTDMRRKQAASKGDKSLDGLNGKNKIKQEYSNIKSTLLDYYVLDKQGKLSIKPGVNWQIGSDAEKQLITRLHGISKKLQGAYSEFDKNLLQRNALGRAVMMYKKYLPQAVDRRFGKMSRDEELGDITEGYYRTLLRTAFSDIVHTVNAMRGKRSKSDKRKLNESLTPMLQSLPLVGRVFNNLNMNNSGLNEVEYDNLKRAYSDLFKIIMLFVAVSLLAPGDDEDKKNISSLRWFMLYQAERLRKELNGLTMIHPKAVEDNWRILRNPSASSGMIDKLLKFFKQLSDPTEQYEKDSGVNKKGDNKLAARFYSLLSNLANHNLVSSNNFKESMKTSYENLNRTN